MWSSSIVTESQIMVSTIIAYNSVVTLIKLPCCVEIMKAEKLRVSMVSTLKLFKSMKVLIHGLGVLKYLISLE